MTNLLDLYNSNQTRYKTDKETKHCYISQVYTKLFEEKKESKKILEIGVRFGGSILLWKDYFLNAQIYGLDNKKCEILSNENRITFLKKNAYTKETASFVGDNFDIIIDDGPHTIDSMIFVIQHYSKLLNTNGVLIIEDIQSYSWYETLIKYTTDIKFLSYDILDLRHIKNRYDDMLFVLRHNYG